MGEAVEHGGPHLQLHHLSLEGARHHPLGDPLALSAFVYGAQFFVTYFCLVGLLIPSAYLTARPLAGIVRHVTLIEFDSKLRADAVLQRKLFSLPNVTVIVSALSTEVHGDGQKVSGLSYQDRTNATLRRGISLIDKSCNPVFECRSKKITIRIDFFAQNRCQTDPVRHAGSSTLKETHAYRV